MHLDERNVKLNPAAIAGLAGEHTPAAYFIQALVHVRQPVAFRLGLRRIKTFAIVLHHDGQSITLPPDFELQFSGFGMFGGVVESLLDGQQQASPKRKIERDC